LLSTSIRRNSGWFAAGIVIVVIIIVASVLVYGYLLNPSLPASSNAPVVSSNPSASNVTITIFAGELGPTRYGFGNTSSTITSPGPSFTVKVGSIVTVKFSNAGSMGHNWALVTQKSDGFGLLAFPGSGIQSGLNPVTPAGTGECTFVASTAGNYYYICQVGTHVSLGMWGNFYVVQ
jgi:plastocyanin